VPVLSPVGCVSLLLMFVDGFLDVLYTVVVVIFPTLLGQSTVGSLVPLRTLVGNACKRIVRARPLVEEVAEAAVVAVVAALVVAVAEVVATAPIGFVTA